ncbi:hypothetical protein PISMIDRAFT_106716 [Pisolithus microcarpus 441]|uniref:Uncharacterized protein n=1 Tax=Pisolithus microcarpus 441 TaxID=765257 RepID=A0A0C9ZIX9_9AGAM|nr:hypothetical protein PISMIDRAFT_106716 [Pisolithus microcarpus 441]
MGEYGSGGEGVFEADEGRVAFLRKVPRHIFSGEAGQQHDYLRIVMDESSIEVCEPKEGLDVPDFSWFRPITDGLNLLLNPEWFGPPNQTKATLDIAEVLNQVPMELTLFRFGIQAMAVKAVKYLFYMFSVRLQVVDHDADIEHVGEDAIYEPLEGSWHISKTKRHYSPLIGTVAGAEGSLPFITIGNSDEVVGMVEVNLGINFHTAWGVKKVRDEQ